MSNAVCQVFSFITAANGTEMEASSAAEILSEKDTAEAAPTKPVEETAEVTPTGSAGDATPESVTEQNKKTDNSAENITDLLAEEDKAESCIADGKQPASDADKTEEAKISNKVTDDGAKVEDKCSVGKEEVKTGVKTVVKYGADVKKVDTKASVSNAKTGGSTKDATMAQKVHLLVYPIVHLWRKC